MGQRCKILQVAKDYTLTKRGPKKPHNTVADLSSQEVELIRRLHEIESWGYKRIAKKFDKPRQTIRYICLYRRR